MNESKRRWTHEHRPETGRGIFEGDRLIASTNSGLAVQVRDDDARLIAAAPELLEALIELHKHLDFEIPIHPREPYLFDDPSGINRAYELGYAAIKKAEGETP